MSLSSMSTNPEALLAPLFDPITVVDETPSQPWLVDHPKLRALTAARRQRLDQAMNEELAALVRDASDAVTVGTYSIAVPRGPLVPDDFAAKVPDDAELVDAAIGRHQRLVFGAGLATLGLVAGVAIALVSSL
jgi:hypothetical protein